MTGQSRVAVLAPEIQRRYQNNVARHILGVSLYLQTAIMERLTRDHGHTELRINFEPYLSLTVDGGARLSDIAEALGVSRQAANQVANQVVAAGYLERRADPEDGRAKLLVTTPRARALISTGSTLAQEYQQTLAAATSPAAVEELSRTLLSLNAGLGLLSPLGAQTEAVLAATLPRLADFTLNRLQSLTMARGHPALKRSFGAVLTAIGPGGGRIQQIARAQDVSKQAVSAIAAELEQLGYILRVPDPDDARQVLLHFTARGVKLIEDSVVSIDEMEAQFAQQIGKRRLRSLCQALEQLHAALHLDEDVFGSSVETNLEAMARRLRKELGTTASRELARLLVE